MESCAGVEGEQVMVSCSEHHWGLQKRSGFCLEKEKDLSRDESGLCFHGDKPPWSILLPQISGPSFSSILSFHLGTEKFEM